MTRRLFLPVNNAVVSVQSSAGVAGARSSLLRSIGACCLLTAIAQQAAANTVAASSESPALEEITVTAERRAQSVQSVGAAISVISGDALIERNANNLYDIQYLTPSLQITPQFGSGQPSYAIRGVGFSDYSSNNAPTVGLYLDEVAYPVPFGTNGAMFDIQRVEVLRGPQGTLYGRNTTGGAVNFILNKPTDEWEGGLDAQYGRFDATKISGFVSGPLAPGLQFRLAAETQQGGAWQHDSNGISLGDANREGGRLLLDFEPNDTLKFELNIHGSYDRSDAAGLHLYEPLTSLNTLVSPSAPIYPADTDPYIAHWGTSPSFAAEIGIQPNTKPFSHIDTTGFSLRTDQSLNFATVTDLLSYDYLSRKEYDNFDAYAGGIADVYYNTRANVFANELRLTSTGDGPLSWIAGFYYANQYLNDNYRSGFVEVFGVDASVRYSQTVNTESGFGQATYKISDQLALTGGFRLEHEERDLNSFSSFFLIGGAVINPSNAVGPQSTSYTKPSGKAELQYHPIPNDMVYASFSEGVKSGGFTTYNTGSPQTATAPFLPETVEAYELGNKLDIPSQHLRFNTAAFYYDYHNQQIQSATVNATTGLVGAIVNAPSSHLYGGEVEADWAPINHLKLTQSAGYAAGRFDVFQSVITAVRQNGIFVGVYGSRAGTSLPAPKFTANGSASYDVDLDEWDVVLEGDYSLRSAYRSLFGTLYDVPNYTIVNASVTLSPKDSRWNVAVFGQNILDRRYDVTRNFFVAGDDIALSGMPATWGIRTSIKF